MNTNELKQAIHEAHAIDRGKTAPARVREVTRMPDGTLKRVTLDPESYRRKQARAWKAKTEAAKIRRELNLTQADFAELLGISPATVRKWERGSGEPSSAAKTLLAVARTHPEIVRKVTCAG
jgi:DNA-binding transcriptional regulator YiaG